MTADHETLLGGDAPVSPADVADDFFARVRDLDDAGALAVVREALAAGVDHESLVLDVIAVSQMRVGMMWQANELSVTREHAATHIGELALGLVLEHGLARVAGERPLGSVVVACVEGEWHGLPARLLGDVLRLRGWRVTFLGASVPAHHLTLHLQETAPDVVALSCSLPSHLVNAHAMITAAARTGVPVIAGGRGFGPDSSLALRLGASLWAADARSAADLLERRMPLSSLRPREEALSPAAEYASLVQRRRDLVRTGVEHARALYEARGASLEGVDLDRTVEDLGHITDFLLTSLYVGDGAVFTRFLAWTRGVLEVRGVPAVGVARVLELLEGELFDYPETCAALREGRAVLG